VGKLVRLWVFLAITGSMAACSESSVGPRDFDDAPLDPNSYVDRGTLDPNGDADGGTLDPNG
jgi:hypothetical protein